MNRPADRRIRRSISTTTPSEYRTIFGRRAAPADTPIRARLNLTENPYGPSPAARRAIVDSAAQASHYVEDESILRGMIARREAVGVEQVQLASGSLDALALLSVDIGRGGEIVAPSLTYDTHLKYAWRRGVPTRRVALAADRQIDFDAMLGARPPAPRLGYVCNPNNPTGLTSDPAALRDFCRAASRRVPVVIDEAFYELLPDRQAGTMAPLVAAGCDVIVTRTFSKAYGMGGLRIGYILAQPARTRQLLSLATTSRNRPALAAAQACLGDEAYLAGAVAYLRKCRQKIYDICAANGLDYLRSDGSFVYVDTARPAQAMREALEAAGVLVRVFEPTGSTWIRVATATPAELDVFGAVLPSVLKRVPVGR